MGGALLRAEAGNKVEAERKLREQLDEAKKRYGMEPDGQDTVCDPGTGEWTAVAHVHT